MEVLAWSEDARSSFEAAKVRWGSDIAYEQAWLYVGQALRRGGWICRNEDGWGAVARDYLGPGRHALVASMSGAPAAFVGAAVAALRQRAIAPQIVKHLSVETADELVAGGHFRRPVPGAKAMEDLSEDRLPQVIVDFTSPPWMKGRQTGSEIPIEPGGARAADFRYQLRRYFRATHERGDVVRQQDIRNVPPEHVDTMLSGWMATVRNRFSSSLPVVKDFDRCFRVPVEWVISHLRNHPEHGFGRIVYVNEVPSAHWGAAPISGSGFGIYTLAADTRIRNLAHYTLYTAMVELNSLGARTVNLGGSEVESLFHFKSRLAHSAPGQRQALRVVCDLIID